MGLQVDNRIKNLAVHDKEYLGSEVVTGPSMVFEGVEGRGGIRSFIV